MNKHWQMPPPLRVIPIRKTDNKKCYFTDSIARGPYYSIPYRIVLDWKNQKDEPQELMEYGGVDISTDSKEKPNVDIGEEDEPLF